MHGGVTSVTGDSATWHDLIFDQRYGTFQFVICMIYSVCFSNDDNLCNNMIKVQL